MEKQILALLTVTLLTTAAYYMNGKDESLTLEGQYNTWKAYFGKRYSQFEEIHRFQIFADNLATVLEHNGKFEIGQEDFTLAMNQFADMTNEEFTAKYLTLKTKSPSAKTTKKYSGKQYPETVDWRTLGLTVKDQGSCGSCWAFSAVGALEGALLQQGDKTLISEQEFVDCTNAKLEYESEGCNGGWMDDAFDYTVKYGVVSAAKYPYTGKDGACKNFGKGEKYFTTSYVDVERLSFNALHEAIAQQPVAVAINAGGIWFQLYSGGIFTRSCAGGEDDLNHGVLAAGYGSNFYIVKNSWGNWGEQGYIRLGFVSGKEKEGQCGIQQLPSYPVF